LVRGPVGILDNRGKRTSFRGFGSKAMAEVARERGCRYAVLLQDGGGTTTVSLRSTDKGGVDLGAFIKSRNRLGYYDAPLQVKMFLGHKRYQFVPFVYAPGGNEAAGDRESGAGALAEFDMLGTGKTVVGLSFAKGTAANGDRRMVGAYTRLGFGRWGILVEHDVTDRTRESPIAASSFLQQASYAQLFVAVREWLVVSAIGERVAVEAPFAERVNAGKLELAARLTNQASIGLAARAQRNQLTGIWSRSLALQVALKSPQ
jgi:hypothetical protein